MGEAVAGDLAAGALREGDDFALVEAARTDRGAFGALYERYVARVYRYCRARTRTPEEADDLTQQVFLQALAALPHYRQRGVPFTAWLFRIARNVAIDAARRRDAARGWEVFTGHQRAPAVESLETRAIGAVALDELAAALRALPTDKQELLALRFGAGLTAREIAAVVGKGEAATKKALARTLDTLRGRFDGD